MLLLLGCAATLAPEPVAEDTGALDSSEVVALDTAVEADGLVTASVRIDATDYTRWIFFDLETGAVVDESDPTWDIAMQRYVFALRGGLVGEGEVAAAVLEGAIFEEVFTAPHDGYITDEPDDDDDGKEPEYALGGWYDYDSTTHILTPAAVVYVIWTGEGFHRFEVLDYYSEAGTSGHLSFRWGEINLPDE